MLAAANYRKWIHIPFQQLAADDVRTSILDAIDTAAMATPPR